VLVMGVAGFAISRAFDWWTYEVNTPLSDSGRPVSVTISQGDTPSQVADQLHSKHLIRSRDAFVYYMRLSGGAGRLQAGDFSLSPNMSIAKIATTLQSGQLEQLSVAFPEGYTLKLMAKTAEKAGLGTADQYTAAASDPTWSYDFLAAKPKDASLEGYLFPDTYSVNRTASVRDLIKRQLDQFGAVFSADLRAQAAQATAERPAQSIQSIVILASIVEREVNRDPDRALVCSVLYNRLRINQPLQVDATVLYALGEWKAALTANDLKVSSPYNTYLRPGLPPGPIANPGAAAIKACIKPEKSDYLFYFTDPKGVTHFERTASEFSSDIQKYGVAGQ
jgi:UPF0755 protein